MVRTLNTFTGAQKDDSPPFTSIFISFACIEIYVVLSFGFRNLGAVGIVTDTGFRDLNGIKSRVPGFQVFSPGLVVSHGHEAYLDFNVTVSICGLTIQPGDLLHGDESGVLTVPIEIAERVVERAQLIQKAEKKYFDFLQSEEYTFEGLKNWLAHPYEQE